MNRILHLGVPALTGRGDERILVSAICWLREERKSVSHVWSWPWMSVAESLESKAGCQSVSKARDVSRQSAHLMSEIDGLHPFLDEWKQHVQGRVTCCESKLLI